MTFPERPEKFKPARKILPKWVDYHAATYPGRSITPSWLSRNSEVPYDTCRRYLEKLQKSADA